MIYSSVAAGIFLALAAIWNRRDWGNAAVKVAFFFMAAWGGFVAIHDLGAP
jgi:hypothetical protein